MFDTYTINNNVQSNTTIIQYVIYWTLGDMFRFPWNHPRESKHVAQGQ